MLSKICRTDAVICLGNKSTNCTYVFECHNWLRAGHTVIKDNDHTRRPITRTMPTIIAQLQHLIYDNLH